MTPIPGKLYRARYSQAHHNLNNDRHRTCMVHIGSIMMLLGVEARTGKCVFLTGDGSIIYDWLGDSFMLIEELQEQP